MKKFQFCYTGDYKFLVGQLLYLLISTSLMCSTEGQDPNPDQENCVESTKNSLTVATCQNWNSIPEGVRADIQSLILDNNKISRIENSEFKTRGLIHLQRLSMKNNIIRSIERDAFEGLQILNVLDLSNNKLENIDPEIFAPLFNLKELKLSGNPLQRFVNSQMPGLLSLKVFDLSNCLLTTLNAGLFDNIYNLEKLDLSGNKLQQVSVDVVSPLRVLNSLNLAKNSWKCDCNIRDFHKWVVERQLASNTNCAGSSKHWEDMANNELFCAPVLNYLRVHVINQQPYETADVILEEGSNVIFECEVEGDPSPDILWTKDDKIMYSSANTTDLKNDKYVLYTLAVGHSRKLSNLTVKGIKVEDQGVYSCQGANTGGIKEKKVHLGVNEVALGGGPFLEKSKTWVWILVGVLGFLMLLLALIIVVSCYVKHRQSTRKSQRVADGKELTYEKKPPADETDTAVSSPLLQKPDVVLAQEIPLGTSNSHDLIQSDRIENPAMRPLPLLYGHQPRLATTPSYLSNSQIFIPHQFDQPYGGWASYDPRRAPQTPVSLHYRTPGPYGRLHSPFSGSVASFTSEPAPRVPPGLGYVTLPRRRRIPSWSPASGYPRNQAPVPPSPTGSLPASNFRMRYQPTGPRYDTIGPRTTADGGSNLSLNTVGLTQNQPAPGRTPTGYTTPMTPSTPSSGRIPRTAYTPMTPLSGRVLKPGPNLQNYMTLPSHFNFDPIQENEGPPTPGTAPPDNLWSHRDGLNNSNVPIHTYPSQTPLYSSDHRQNIPPVPPAKPKRKSMNLDEQEQEMPNLANIPGTEV